MNPWHDARLLNLAANGLMALGALALLVMAGAWVAQRPAFALKALVVEPLSVEQPLHHLHEATLRAAGVSRLRGTFFTVDLIAVKEAFEQVPWVRRAEVRRVWPSTLQVAIEEHQPLAIWQDGRLVNRQGELFTASVAEAESDGALLEFSGPPGSESEVTRLWKVLHEAIAPLQLAPEAVSLSPRWAWSTRLDNGTVLLLGREQGLPIAERVARWVSMHPTIQQRLNREIASIDLRYQNGFALRVPGALYTGPGVAGRKLMAPPSSESDSGLPAVSDRPQTSSKQSQ